MRYFDVNNNLSMYERKTQTVTTAREGYKPVSEAAILRSLAEALQRYELLGEAIADMRVILDTCEIPHE